MIDPGDPNTLFPQSFPGHPRDFALEYYAAAPPGVDYAAGAGMPLAAMAGSFLKVSPAGKNLYIDYVKTDKPWEGRSVLREIYNKAIEMGAKAIRFHPENINMNLGSKRSMADMVKQLGATQVRGERTQELPISKLEDLLGITKKKQRSWWEDRLRDWSMDQEVTFGRALEAEQRYQRTGNEQARKHAEGMLNKAIQTEEFINKMRQKYLGGK